MSKVILQGNLIDLEMITHISAQLDGCGKLRQSTFAIHLIGKDKIYIEVRFKGDWHSLKEFNEKSDDAIKSAQKMYDALVSRWSPSVTKFDDLTVE